MTVAYQPQFGFLILPLNFLAWSAHTERRLATVQNGNHIQTTKIHSTMQWGLRSWNTTTIVSSDYVVCATVLARSTLK